MFFGRKKDKKSNTTEYENTDTKDAGQIKLPINLQDKLDILKPYKDRNFDMVVRPLEIKDKQRSTQAAVVYIDNITDKNVLHQDVLKPLSMLAAEDTTGYKNLIEYVYKNTLTAGDIVCADGIPELVHAVFDGFTVLMIDGYAEILIIKINNGHSRAIEEPLLDRSISGPREGFVESLAVNISLIRHKLRDPNLAVEKKVLGRRTRSNIAVLYIKDIASKDIVSEVFKRLDEIDVDGILSVGQLVQYFDDNPYSFFQLNRQTERVDIVVANLLEGRVAVMSDQSPLVAMYPTLFIETLQAAEDYYQKAQYGTFMRLLRILAFIISVSLPAFYISLISFRQELIPFDLIIPLIESRKDVPFPAVVEVLLLEFMVQIIIEAGLRMPGNLSQTVGIVAGIILGQAMIAAKLASPAAIILIAITTISTFVIPNICLSMATRLIRIFFLITSSVFGLYGFSFGWFLILTHLTSQESMGVPYFSPFAPTRYADLKDSFYRSNIWNFKNRPVSIPVQDRKRQGNNRKRGGTDKKR